MENKKIIGLIGNKKLTRDISFNLEKRGFYRLSIDDKVKDMASYLLPENEIEKEVSLKKVRNKAYNVHRWYWINIVLSSIPQGCKYVVIDDLLEEDVVPNVIDVYRVSENNVTDIKKEIFQ